MAGHFLGISLDILIIVLDYLCEEDIVALMSTCRALRAIICDCPIWRKRFLLYTKLLRCNSDFCLDDSPSWRLFTISDNAVHDQFLYSVDVSGQRGFHPELCNPISAISRLKGGWRQALFSILDTRCDCCRAYCGTYHVLLMVRVCTSCIQERVRFSVVLEEEISKNPYISPQDLNSLPHRTLSAEANNVPREQRTYYALEHCNALLQCRGIVLDTRLSAAALRGR
jgi:hypothetical protein